METLFEIELEIEPIGAELRVTARGSRGERPAPQSLGADVTLDRLDAFARDVGRAVKKGKQLEGDALTEAQALHGALISGAVRDLILRMGEAAKGSFVLLRLLLRHRGLQAVPWEALCEPGTTSGFLGADPRVKLARGVTSPDPWEPREVLGPVRILAIAPTLDEASLGALREALAEPIEAGEIEWLDPITSTKASQRLFFDALRRGKTPHMIHFLGHGGIDPGGSPTLRLADDDDGEAVWIKVEALARELAARFGDDLRLITLEACEGAQPGALGSAAEMLAQAGADAVVAHLWPVKADVARLCSRELYRSLTSAARSAGDVAASLGEARRALLLGSAEGLSPVLYLRGAGSSIFSFDGRKLDAGKAKLGASSASKSVAPALLGVLEKPFSLVLGDGGEADRAALADKLRAFLTESGDTHTDGLTLSALAQRCELRFGLEKLSELFQDALWEKLDTPAPPLASALARLTGPGVHVTLLWFPSLERALAREQPDRTIYVIQPSLRDPAGKPRVVRRARGASGWTKEAALPKSFDFESDILVLRLYGGYSPEPRPIFTSAMLTEDDHINGFVGVAGARPPAWADELLGRLRLRPALFLGLSVLEWRHRMLLRWLYDGRPAPKDSMALLDASTEDAELEIWDSGGGLPGTGRIAPLREDAEALAALLAALPGREAV